jgi:hypothetical protein
MENVSDEVEHEREEDERDRKTRVMVFISALRSFETR